MSDLISRQAAIDAVNIENLHRGIVDALQNIISELPAIENDLSGYSDRLWKAAYERGKAEAVKHGKWIKMSDADGIYWACSECGEELPRFNHLDPIVDLFPRLKSVEKKNYCPNCGAQMERSEE